MDARFFHTTTFRNLCGLTLGFSAAAGFRGTRIRQSLRLLTSYLSTADEGLTFANPELRHLFVMRVYDLMALTFGATSDAAELAQNRGLRAARLSSIKSEIDARLGEGTLTVNGVAAAHGVTPRYVQLLFEREGTTFSEYLLAQRLIRTHRMLASPRFACRTIGTIAFEVGFNDLSYFNRSFRRRFGATPSDVRANLAGGARPATHDPAIRQIKRTLRFT